MKKEYKAPALAVYGQMRDLTLGISGDAPDAATQNDDCLTAIIGTRIVTCATVPLGS